MILPLRVLGRSPAKRMASGRAMAPIFFTTCSLSSRFSSSLAVWPSFSVTKAATAWAFNSCALPTTAASAAPAGEFLYTTSQGGFSQTP